MGFDKKIVSSILLLFIVCAPVYPQKIKVKSSVIYSKPQSKTSVKLSEKALKDNNLIVIPRGRRINSRLNDNLVYERGNNKSIQTGDIITTQLMSDWIYDSVTVAPEGSLVKGKLTILPNGTVTIDFSAIIRPDNVEVKIVSKPIEIAMPNSYRGFSIPFGTEFTIQIINDVITSKYEN